MSLNLAYELGDMQEQLRLMVVKLETEGLSATAIHSQLILHLWMMQLAVLEAINAQLAGLSKQWYDANHA